MAVPRITQGTSKNETIMKSGNIFESALLHWEPPPKSVAPCNRVSRAARDSSVAQTRNPLPPDLVLDTNVSGAIVFARPCATQEREKNEDDSDDETEGSGLEEEKREQAEASARLLAEDSAVSLSSPVPATGATLSEVNLEVKPGELVCVYGPTGCGKSSLLLSLLGEVRRVEGTVEVSAYMQE